MNYITDCRCDICRSAEPYDDGLEYDEEGRVMHTTLMTSTSHVAAKDYADDNIRKGDMYRRSVAAGYSEGGPRFLNVTRWLLGRKRTAEGR